MVVGLARLGVCCGRRLLVLGMVSLSLLCVVSGLVRVSSEARVGYAGGLGFLRPG